MIGAGLLLLTALVPGRSHFRSDLRLAPDHRTFPEIAALVGATPTEVKCDPAIAHRMAFASAGSISREGLLGALGLVVVPDGKTMLMKAKDATRDREWTTSVRRSLALRWERTLSAALSAIENETGVFPSDDWSEPFTKVLLDPKSTPAERKRADAAFLETFGRVLVGGEESTESVAGVRLFAGFPSEVPLALFENGSVVDVLPLTSFPSAAVAALRKAYPKLEGGPDSVVVRRRTLGGIAGPLGMIATVSIVDPQIVAQLGGSLFVLPVALNAEGSVSAALAGAERDGTLRLRGFATELQAMRSGESDGRPMIERMAAETLAGSVAGRVVPSLSELAERWAAKGHDVILELDPVAESSNVVFTGTKLRLVSDWSPQVIEGVLVLRPILRFVNARRRWPLRAIFALEATGARPSVNHSMYGAMGPPPAQLGAYVKLAGPDDTWGYTQYRGWQGTTLDSAARAQRVRNLVPRETLVASEQTLKAIWAKDPPIETPSIARKMATKPFQTWTHRLAELPPSTQQAILREMRASNTGQGNDLAFSPAASALFLREGVLTVQISDTMRGYMRRIYLGAPDVPAFNARGSAGLTGD